MRRLAVVLLAPVLAAVGLHARRTTRPCRSPSGRWRRPSPAPRRSPTGPTSPVLLVHGTFTNPEENWSWNYLNALPAAGYDVCTVRLPEPGHRRHPGASEYVVYAVRRIFERSGSKVDMLGHSQGGLEPRWALRWWPSLRTKVDDLVTLGAPHHGTTVANAATARAPRPPPGRCGPTRVSSPP